MAGCKDCFNGCVETTSDACVKYTGIPYPAFGIDTGDSLKIVEESILNTLLTIIDGTGIVIDIDSSILCPIIIGYLPASGPITIVDYTTALIKTACFIEGQVNTLTTRVNVIEGNYAIGCLTGVTPASGTHVILQAVLDKLCTVVTDLAALAANLATNYVRKDEVDAYIEAYLESISVSTLQKNKMVPNTVVEYYGTTANFDITGAGTGDWVEIYLCNGQNNTPDKRGRSPIGAITGMGGGALNPNVDPAVSPANPAYSLLTTRGTNEVVLNSTQVPNHGHTAVVHEDPHTHNQTGKVDPGGNEGSGGNDNPINGSYPVSPSKTNLTVEITPTTGGGFGHANIHPVLACYYIMYIPNP